MAKERPAPEKPGRGVGGGRSGGGFGLGTYAGGGVEFGSEFDDAAGGAGGLGVCGNPVLRPEMKVTLDAEAETAPEFEKFKKADIAQLREPHAQIGESEGDLAGEFRIELRQQPRTGPRRIEQLDHGFVVGAWLGAVGVQTLALLAGEKFHEQGLRWV